MAPGVEALEGMKMANQSVDFGDRDGGSWGTVRRGRKYFTVETFSRYQGTRSGTIARVPFDAHGLGIGQTDDLAADYNDFMSNADYVRSFADRYPDVCRVVKRGYIVQ